METIIQVIIERTSGVFLIVPLRVFFDHITHTFAMPNNVRVNEQLTDDFTPIINAKFSRKLRRGHTVYKEESI